VKRPNRPKPHKRQKPVFWTIPKIWEGQTVFVVGGGPSLVGFNFEQLQGERIVAINLAFHKLPFAQFLFFADNRFWGWHEPSLMRFQNHVCTTAMNVAPPHPHFHRIKRDYDQTKWFSTEENTVIGKDSGAQAVNLAYHLGAQRIILLGFDMGFRPLTDEEVGQRKFLNIRTPRSVEGKVNQNPIPRHLSHWYQDHPIPSREQNYKTRFLPQYSQIVKVIHAEGREIYLGTPSAIEAIPQINLADVLGVSDAESVGPDQGQAALQE
jgi:hypothetical protein